MDSLISVGSSQILEIRNIIYIADENGLKFGIGIKEMVFAAHIIIYTQNSEADRNFFKDILGFPYVDAGDGWLIFALPPSEVAFHPAPKNGPHELFLMCKDIRQEMALLKAKGVRFSRVSETAWGLTTRIHLPGGGRLALYQPKHAMAISPPSE